MHGLFFIDMSHFYRIRILLLVLLIDNLWLSMPHLKVIIN